MLRYIIAQPFHGVLFSVCSSRAVLTKQIVAQSCLVLLGCVLVLHNHAKTSVVLFIPPPSRCSWHSCAGEREVFTYFCPCCGWSVTPSDGSFSAGWGVDGMEMTHPPPTAGNRER